MRPISAARGNWASTDYAAQQQIAQENGCAFAVVSNGRDCWGTDAGTARFASFCRYLTDALPVRRALALWATSAGGVTALRTIAAGETAVSFCIGTFPVYDLRTEYGILESCRAAFGDLPPERFEALIAGKNPPDLTEPLKRSGCRFYIAHGSADCAVPLAQNSLRLASELGDAVVLQTVEGGVHGTSDGRFYGGAVRQAFAGHPAEYVFTDPLDPGDAVQLRIRYADGTSDAAESVVTA